MVRSHVTKVTAVLLLTLALGAVPARAAGVSPERFSRWEQLAEVFFGWLLKTGSGGAPIAGLETTSMIDPDGKAGVAPTPGAAALCLDTTSCIDPFGKAGVAPSPGTAALCLEYSSCIDPFGRN